MIRIKKFQDYKVTNEFFGWGKKNNDNDLGKTIIQKLILEIKKCLVRWLKKQSVDYQIEWIEKHAQPLIDAKSGRSCPHPFNQPCGCKKNSKDPELQWPRLFHNGSLTVEEAVDWVYKNEKENRVEWNLVYDATLPRYLERKAEQYYFFIDEFNGKKFRCEIMKNLDYNRNGIVVTMTEGVSQQGRLGTGLKVPTKGGSKDYVPGFSDDYDSQSELNLSKDILTKIFSEAQKLYEITNPSAKKSARPPL
jgi:hypothetical protein